jgi:hypothetical protein
MSRSTNFVEVSFRFMLVSNCFTYTILDLRDPATVPLNFTKSINLALSERGINAIRHANRPGLLDSVLQETIPMRGRMIHGEKNGRISQESQAYDIHGRVRINSIKCFTTTFITNYYSSSVLATVQD